MEEGLWAHGPGVISSPSQEPMGAGSPTFEARTMGLGATRQVPISRRVKSQRPMCPWLLVLQASPIWQGSNVPMRSSWPWSQMGPGSKWALGPNGPWPQMSFKPKWELGTNGRAQMGPGHKCVLSEMGRAGAEKVCTFFVRVCSHRACLSHKLNGNGKDLKD